MPARRSASPPRSVWLRPERAARDRQLSRAVIVSAAIEILDAEGHEGLSMRRIADRLGVTVGSLYWHVATKAELMELAADAVTGEVGPGSAGANRTDSGRAGAGRLRAAESGLADGWREALAALAHDQRAMLLRHPWVIALMSSQPDMGPNALRVAEHGLGILTRAGFGPELADAALAALRNQVTGAVMAETAWRQVTQGPAGTLADWQQQAGDYLRDIEEHYPLVAARFATGPRDITQASTTRFEIAIACLLDGLETRLG